MLHYAILVELAYCETLVFLLNLNLIEQENKPNYNSKNIAVKIIFLDKSN